MIIILKINFISIKKQKLKDQNVYLHVCRVVCCIWL